MSSWLKTELMLVSWFIGEETWGWVNSAGVLEGLDKLNDMFNILDLLTYYKGFLLRLPDTDISVFWLSPMLIFFGVVTGYRSREWVRNWISMRFPSGSYWVEFGNTRAVFFSFSLLRETLFLLWLGMLEIIAFDRVLMFSISSFSGSSKFRFLLKKQGVCGCLSVAQLQLIVSSFLKP